MQLLIAGALQLAGTDTEKNTARQNIIGMHKQQQFKNKEAHKMYLVVREELVALKLKIEEYVGGAGAAGGRDNAD